MSGSAALALNWATCSDNSRRGAAAARSTSTSRDSRPTRCCTTGTRGMSLAAPRRLQRAAPFALRAPGVQPCSSTRASRSCMRSSTVRRSSRRCDRASMRSSSAKRWPCRRRCPRASCVLDTCTVRTVAICAPIARPFGSAGRIGRGRPRRSNIIFTSSMPRRRCSPPRNHRVRADLLRHRR